MAKTVLTDVYVSIDSVDLSDHVRSVTLPLSAAEIEKTCMGDSSVGRLAGLKDVTISITFANDFAASKIEPTMWSIYDAGVAVTIIVRVDNSEGVGAANPNFTFSAILTNWPVIDGAVGDLSETTIDFMGDGDVARSTS